MAGQNFADDPNVLIMVLVAGIVGLILLGDSAGNQLSYAIGLVFIAGNQMK